VCARLAGPGVRALVWPRIRRSPMRATSGRYDLQLSRRHAHLPSGSCGITRRSLLHGSVVVVLIKGLTRQQQMALLTPLISPVQRSRRPRYRVTGLDLSLEKKTVKRYWTGATKLRTVVPALTAKNHSTRHPSLPVIKIQSNEFPRLRSEEWLSLSSSRPPTGYTAQGR
jgi:hypothetical protein